MRSISIVLCTYNGAKFLNEQLHTLRAQRGVQEIIAVDDRSTDDTMAVLYEHAAEDPRVRVYWNEQRLGVVGNFERAVSLATGEWLAFADQDDVWLPHKIERLQAAWDGESGLLHHATRKFHHTPSRELPPRAGETRKYRGRDPRRLLYRNSIVGHTTLVRAEVVRQLLPFPPDVPHDWWIGIGAALLGKVQYVDEYLVHYRIHGQNTYHRAGSRVQRMRAEHGLRMALLNELCLRPELAGRWHEFVRQYWALLLDVMPGQISWPLLRHYWDHATLYFGDGFSPVSFSRRARRSVAAALAAASQQVTREPSRSGVFGELAEPSAPERRAGWRVATVSAIAMVASVVLWIFRVEAAPTASLATTNSPTPQMVETTARPPAVVPTFAAQLSEPAPLALETLPPPALRRAGWRQSLPRWPSMMGPGGPPPLLASTAWRPPGGPMRPPGFGLPRLSWAERLRLQPPLIAMVRRRPIEWSAGLRRVPAAFRVPAGGERFGGVSAVMPPPPPEGMPRLF